MRVCVDVIAFRQADQREYLVNEAFLSVSMDSHPLTLAKASMA